MNLTHVFFSLIFILSASSARALSFKEVTQSETSGLDSLGESEKARLLTLAQSFARFRKAAPNSALITDYLTTCQDDSGANLFCRFVHPRPEIKAPALAPIWRLKLTHAVSALNLVNARPRTCMMSSKILQSIVNEPTATRLHARALYWLWVCAKARKDEKEAALHREALWTKWPLDHHTFLILKKENDPRLRELAHDEEDLNVELRSRDNAEANAALTAIEALHRIKKDDVAALVASEFEESSHSLEPEVRLYFAALMVRVSKAIPSVLPVTQVLLPILVDHREVLRGVTARALFPIDYPVFDSQRGKDLPLVSMVQNMVQNSGIVIDLGILFGLMHYESAFNPAASSSANAYGLLQVISSTANSVYSQMTPGALTLTPDQLLDARLSLQIGAEFLKELHASYNRSWPLALAAYNAGEPAVQSWRDENPSLKDPQVVADLIFMNDPKRLHVSDYIATVLGKADWYSLLHF